MKIRLSTALLFAGLILACRPAGAQVTPKTADVTFDVRANGSVVLTMAMSFDAAGWRQWRAQVGDEPARLRGLMKHQFAAYVIDDFQFEKDDLNRKAKVTLRSPAGPQLLSNGHLGIPIEPYFRLVNHAGREWFFSGNNPYAGNSLNTERIVLPVSLETSELTGAGGPEQVLVYSVVVPVGRSRYLVWSGVVLLLVGAAALGGGILARRRPDPGSAVT